MFLLLVPAFAEAAEYSLENSFKVLTRYNDNIRLTPENPVSLQGQTMQPKVLAKVAGNTWNVNLDIDLRFNSFNRSEFDSDDQTVELSGTKKTERQTFALSTNIVRDSTRTSETASTGSGFVDTTAERKEMYSITPQWTYLVTDRNYLSVTGGVSETDYAGERFTDYNYDNLGIGWTRIVDENLRVTLQLTGSLYEPEARAASFGQTYTSESKSYGAQLGGEYSLTEKLTLNGLIGSTYTDQEYDVQDPQDACTNVILALLGLTPALCSIEDYSSSNLVADVSMEWAGERNTINLAYSVQNQPSNQGYEVEYERYNVSWDLQVTAKSKIKLLVEFGSNKAVDRSVSSIDPNNINRDFGNAVFNYYWRVNENWRFNTRYRYAWQDREQVLGDAESNSIEVGISYQPAKSIWSR